MSIEQHITVASNMSAMLGHGAYTERERGIARKAYLAGERAGRLQVALGDSALAVELYRELSGLHAVVDWSADPATHDRIATLLARAQPEAQP